MLSHSVTPMAYRSDSTLAQAILPCGRSQSSIGPVQTPFRAKATYLHVGILDQRVEEVRGLDQRQAGVAEGRDGGVHADTDPGVQIRLD